MFEITSDIGYMLHVWWGHSKLSRTKSMQCKNIQHVVSLYLQIYIEIKVAMLNAGMALEKATSYKTFKGWVK